MKTKNNNEPSLTVREFSTRAGVTPDYVRHLIRDKKIKALKWGDRWSIKLSELDKFSRRRFPRVTNEHNTKRAVKNKRKEEQLNLFLKVTDKRKKKNGSNK